MQYWNYLDRSEDDEQAEETMLGEVQSDFDGASSGGMRDTNPNQQYFDFGEVVNPSLDDLDKMSGFSDGSGAGYLKMDPLSQNIDDSEPDSAK